MKVVKWTYFEDDRYPEMFPVEDAPHFCRKQGLPVLAVSEHPRPYGIPVQCVPVVDTAHPTLQVVGVVGGENLTCNSVVCAVDTVKSFHCKYLFSLCVNSLVWFGSVMCVWGRGLPLSRWGLVEEVCELIKGKKSRVIIVLHIPTHYIGVDGGALFAYIFQ